MCFPYLEIFNRRVLVSCPLTILFRVIFMLDRFTLLEGPFPVIISHLSVSLLSAADLLISNLDTHFIHSFTKSNGFRVAELWLSCPSILYGCRPLEE